MKIDKDNNLTSPIAGSFGRGRPCCRYPDHRTFSWCFTQRDDMFNRAFWDDDIRRPEMMEFFESYRVGASISSGSDGFTQKDFALRNAAWAVSDEFSSRGESEGIREGFNAPLQPTAEPAATRVDVDDPDAMAAEIKRVAKLFGAGIVGIAPYDSRWTYAARADSKTFEARETGCRMRMTSVIVLGHEMDIDMVATYPSAVAGAATGNAYSEEVSTVIRLSQYIRNLGWQAAGSMNDTALVIPYALQAGLGEYARNQMVITPEFGPRVRFSKDLHRSAVGTRWSLGCSAFGRSAMYVRVVSMPVRSRRYPAGHRPKNSPNRSAIRGVVKWTSDAEKCFGFWADLRSDCAICLRVCPWNRDFGKWSNRLWRWLARTRVRRLLIWVEGVTKRGKRQHSTVWWARGFSGRSGSSI